MKKLEVKSFPGSLEIRTATLADCELMFSLQKLNGAPLSLDDAEQAAAFFEYKRNFRPGEIQVVCLEGEPVGRLRVVREEEIYLGGMQILPEHRNKGLGTAILENLIVESKRTSKPIRLEVFHENQRAFNLYKKVGFKVVGENEQQKIMLFEPR